MTEEQQKQIAQVTILNSSIIASHFRLCGEMMELMLPVVPDKERAQILLSELHRLQDMLNDLQPSLDAAKQDFGLD
jgi:hypothetical protein